MTHPTRPRRASRSKKTLVVAAATILFAIGLYAGFELAKPPPKPDFGTTSRSEPSTVEPSEAPSRPAIRPVEPQPVEPAEAQPAEPQPAAIETPPAERTESLVIRRQPAPEPSGGAPRVSIVIDDLGRGLRNIDDLASLGIPLTYSVLPFETHTAKVVAELKRRGVEYLCHLPMEAKSGANPGPGALLAYMSHEQLQAATREALAAVPGAVGVNNHMGSGMLPMENAMTSVLQILSQRGLYFLDSRTSADTVGYSLARHMGMRAAERQVFLDTVRDAAFIRAQFDSLLATARKRGGAIAIAHPYRETLDMLATAIPSARAEGFEFVTVSALLDQ